MVMTGVAGVIVTASVWVPVPPALVALRVTVEAPAVVGVPERSPVAALSARPAGNPVAPKLVGLSGAGTRKRHAPPPRPAAPAGRGRPPRAGAPGTPGRSAPA